MSKQIKEIMVREYQTRMDGLNDAMVISIRGVKAIETTKMRNDLAKKQIRITVVRNSLARKAFNGTSLSGLGEFLTGSSAMAYSKGMSVVEVAREIVKLAEKNKAIELKGAVLDGTLFKGKKGVEELSKYPTKDEAIGQVVTLLVSPARKLAAQILGPGSSVAGLVKAIETKLEKGEAIAKAG